MIKSYFLVVSYRDGEKFVYAVYDTEEGARAIVDQIERNGLIPGENDAYFVGVAAEEGSTFSWDNNTNYPIINSPSVPGDPTQLPANDESELINLEPRVLSITINRSWIDPLAVKDKLWPMLERILDPFGWYVPYMEVNGSRIDIYLLEKGSISLAAIIAIILGVLALVGIISFSWSVIERENTVQAGELTEQNAGNALNDILKNPDISQEIKDEAAMALIRLSEEAGSHEQPSQGDDGGFFSGTNTGTLILGAALLLALSKK